MWVSGWQFLGLTVALVLAVKLAYRLVERRRSSSLRRLAVGRRVRYSRHDRFGLTDRITPQLHGENVQNVVVRDLMYVRRDETYAYVFTVIYSAGHPTSGTRHRNVIVAVEGLDRGDALRIESASLACDLASQYTAALDRLVDPRDPENGRPAPTN